MTPTLTAGRLFFGIFMAMGLSACGGQMAIDDATVAKYIKAYKGLKATSPALAAQLGKKGVDPEAGKAGFAQIEGVIKKAGFSGYPEFVKANAAIGLAFSQIQAGAFMADMDKMQKSGAGQIQAALNNPAVPEATKAQLRAQLAQTQASYAQNKGWADPVMAAVGWASDPKTVDVVTRHRAELQAAFTSK